MGSAVRRVLLATAAVGFIAAVPVTVLMGSAALGLACRPDWYPALGITCAVLAAVSAVLGTWCLGAAMAGPRVVVERGGPGA